MWNEAGGKGRKWLVSCFMIGIRYIDKRYIKFRVFCQASSSSIQAVQMPGKQELGWTRPICQELLRFRRDRLRSGQEAKNFIHHAVGLVRLKKKLRMSVAV